MINRYLTPLLVIVVSLGVYFLYIDAAYGEIKQNLAKEKVVEEFLLNAQNARKKLDKIAAEYNAFPAGTDERLQVILPDTVDQIRLIIDVNAVAERRGLTLSAPTVSLGVSNPETPAEYISHSITFEVTSTYPIFYEFLRDIESSLALRDFGSVTFSAPTEQEADTLNINQNKPEFTVFDYNVKLTTYSLR